MIFCYMGEACDVGGPGVPANNKREGACLREVSYFKIYAAERAAETAAASRKWQNALYAASGAKCLSYRAAMYYVTNA